MDLVLVMKQKLREQSSEVNALFRSVGFISIAAMTMLIVGVLMLNVHAAAPGAVAVSPTSSGAAANPAENAPTRAASLAMFFLVFALGNGLLGYAMRQLAFSRPAMLASPYVVRSNWFATSNIVFPGIYGMAMVLFAAAAVFQLGTFAIWTALVVQLSAYAFRCYSWWRIIVP